MTPERKKKLRVILAILFIHSCDWWLGWEYEVCKAKNHFLFPQLLLRKKAAEELKKEQERKAAERRKVKRRFFDYIASQFSILVQCVFITGWMYFLVRWSTSGVVSRRTWRAPAKVNILLTKQWRAVTLPLGLLSTSLLPPKNSPNPSHFPDYCIPPWPFLPPFMSNITDFVLACSCTFLSLRIRPLLSLLTAALVCRRAGANLQRVSFKSLQTGGGQVGPGEGH